MLDNFADEYINAISSIAPEIPVFGGVSDGIEGIVGEDRSGVQTICCGEVSSDAVVMVLVSGSFTPKFFVSTFADDAVILEKIGTVTKCKNNILLEIDDMNAREFFEKSGFIPSETADAEINAGLAATVLVFDNGNGEMVSRSLIGISGEGVICMGYVSEGAKISIAVSTPDSVVNSAREMVRSIKNEKESGVKTALMYSCIGRRLGLLGEPMKELEVIEDELRGEVVYMMSYTGGEISPVNVAATNKSHNYAHNQTLVACVF
jgi:hypothetical protein